MRKSVFALLLALSLTLTGCAAQAGFIPISNGGDLMADIEPSTGASAEASASPEAAADSTAFAVELLKAAYDGGNAVISPVSAYLALSMVANGAAGDTLKEFEEALGAPVGELNGTCKALLEGLNSSSDGLTLKSVNGIWYNTRYDFKINPEFLQTNADYFGAAEVAADFTKPGTLSAINKFVSDNTNGLIPSILDKLDNDAVTVLVNTLYFKGKWASPFKPYDTFDAEFTTADEGAVLTPTMEQEFKSVRYFDADGVLGVVLPYQDSRYAYVAILPPGGVGEFLTGLTADGFKALLASATEEKVRLFIPKYDVSGDYQLNDMLRQLGLTLAFEPAEADFSRLGTAGDNIYINKVLQKVVFKLDEEGTEAAAVTSVQMNTMSMPIKEEEPVVLRLDRPFVYGLLDMETGAPLFLGVLENPTTE